MDSFIELENARLAWSKKVFCEATPVSSLRKCEKEIEEIEADIVNDHLNPVEYADAIMCLFDSAGRRGISAAEILDAYKAKFIINKNRTWKKNPDNSYSHVKENENYDFTEGLR